jgi:hypothetical protein
MSYKIEQESGRDSSGNYKYRIFRDGRLFAQYWHDFRGDEHGIDFVNGVSEGWPVGRMVDFLEGGGPKPLVISARGIAYLDQKA